MLTLQYVGYNEIEKLDSSERVRKLLNLVKQNEIVLMQGRLKPEEQTMLIEKTMEVVDKKFKGIELCEINPDRNTEFSIKKTVTNMLIGSREGLTLIGPATIIKEIKRNPNKISLFI